MILIFCWSGLRFRFFFFSHTSMPCPSCGRPGLAYWTHVYVPCCPTTVGMEERELPSILLIYARRILGTSNWHDSQGFKSLEIMGCILWNQQQSTWSDDRWHCSDTALLVNFILWFVLLCLFNGDVWFRLLFFSRTVDRSLIDWPSKWAVCSGANTAGHLVRERSIIQYYTQNLVQQQYGS